MHSPHAAPQPKWALSSSIPQSGPCRMKCSRSCEQLMPTQMQRSTTIAVESNGPAPPASSRVVGCVVIREEPIVRKTHGGLKQRLGGKLALARLGGAGDMPIEKRRQRRAAVTKCLASRIDQRQVALD